jgi:hypothetical protein
MLFFIPFLCQREAQAVQSDNDSQVQTFSVIIKGKTGERAYPDVQFLLGKIGEKREFLSSDLSSWTANPTDAKRYSSDELGLIHIDTSSLKDGEYLLAQVSNPEEKVLADENHAIPFTTIAGGIIKILCYDKEAMPPKTLPVTGKTHVPFTLNKALIALIISISSFSLWGLTKRI